MCQLLADLPGLLGPLAGVSVGGHTLVEWAGLVADNVTDSLDLMTSQCAEGDQYLEFCDDVFTTGKPNDLVFEGRFTVTLGVDNNYNASHVVCIAGAKSGVIMALYEYLTSSDYGMLPDNIASAASTFLVQLSDQLVNDFGCVAHDKTSCTQMQLLWNLMDVSLADIFDSPLLGIFPEGFNLQNVATTLASAAPEDQEELGEALRHIMDSLLPGIVKDLVGK